MNWQLAETELRVRGMSCTGCVVAVRSTLQRLPGVSSAEVDLDSGRAVVQFDPARLDPQAMISALGNLGYFAEVAGGLPPEAAHPQE